MDLYGTLKKHCHGRVLQNEPLSSHTSFRIGGPADCFLWATDTQDIEIALDAAAREENAFMIVGNGTNLLVNDEGIRGVVVCLGTGFHSLEQDETLVRSGAAVHLSELLDYCAEHDLGGLEFAAGIPGTVGGALYTNAKTKTGWVRDPLADVTAMDKNKQIQTIDAASFQHDGTSLIDGCIITEASFQLTKAAEEDIRREIERYMSRRRETQPIHEPSAGCIFANPEDQPAGLLIDHCGCKGMRVGGAVVSDKHANFIINTGGARATDVLELIEHVRERVVTEIGITLSLEIHVVDPMGRFTKQ